MGYTTDYTVYWDEEPIPKELQELIENQDDHYISEYYANFSAGKNFDVENELIKISKKYPTVLFMIDARGDEAEDIWRQYFKNKKSLYQKGKIVFDDFDENLMK